MALKDLPLQARPREKLLARGPQALADTELLALLLRTGYKGRGVFEVAQDVLSRCGGFHGLLNADTARLAGIKGLGPAKRAELMAVMEMARRALAEPLHARVDLGTRQQLRDYLALHLAGSPNERFAALFLDTTGRLIEMKVLFEGSLTSVSVPLGEVVRRALALGAASVIVAHNHPSGCAEPSRADEALTKHLRDALALVDVQLVDHLIIGRGSVMSLAERGQL
jgi:DNA repair protein RadC